MLPSVEEDGGADAEVAVGGVGVVGDGDGALLQVCGLGGVERGGRVVVRRHDVSEAIGCGGAIASRVALMVKGRAPDIADVDDLTKEFIAESQEGLDRMERCLTELETRPDDAGLLGEIFRAVHTIKGTTGFLGFDRLEKLAHAGEHLLGSLRDGRLAVTSELISGLLQLMDGLRAILALIEETGGEGTRSSDEDGELIAELALLNGAMPPVEIEPELLHAVVDAGEMAVPRSAVEASKAAGSAVSADLVSGE